MAKTKILCLSALLLVLFNVSSYSQNGAVGIINHKEEAFINTNCSRNKTCDLKKVDYVVEDYSVAVDGGYNYGTRFFARYETRSVKDLEKFVFVQFIRGCDFTSKLLGRAVEVAYDIAYPRDNNGVIFKFTEWIIDSYDSDPVYSTVSGKSRFYGYRWNIMPGSFSQNTEKLYGEQKPKLPQLYIVDHPGSAFYINNRAKNISLQFRTCIYRTKDVPKNVSYNNAKFAKPIHCFEWRSSFVYNHYTEQFESPSYIVPACTG